MNVKKVQEIIMPYQGGVPLKPRVSMDERITEAIRKMLVWDVRRIAVVRKNRPVGLVRLEDALKEIGLELK